LSDEVVGLQVQVKVLSLLCGEQKGQNLRIMKTTTLQLRNSVNSLHIRLALLLIVLACFALSPQARATCQNGCLTNENTVLGEDALIVNINGSNNTAVGNNALSNNTNSDNTAVGAEALEFNTFGFVNTAIGFQALKSNTSGDGNTAVGADALFLSVDGINNTGIGIGALDLNISGQGNTAVGNAALSESTGGGNTAIGDTALASVISGADNIAVGEAAGINLLTGSNNIYIGNQSPRGHESGSIRIGTTGTHRATFIAAISGATVPTGVAVIVDSSGHLGTTTSSARFKEAIKPMDKASEAILALKPVTFRYKRELDSKGIPQFGLVAEDVEKVNPGLVAHDEQGKPYTVRYEAVNAMLLNEFLKEHRTVQEQGATIAELKKQIEALTAGLQKVSAQLEQKTAPQTVSNNQ